MLRKQKQRVEMSVAIRDMEARMNAEKQNQPRPSPANPALTVGAFGAKLLACETLADARRLLGL